MTIRRSAKTKQWAIERPQDFKAYDGFVGIRRISKGNVDSSSSITLVRCRDWPIVPDDQVPDWVWAAIMAEKLK